MTQTELKYRVAEFARRVASRQAQLLNLPTYDLEVDKDNFILRQAAPEPGTEKRHTFECWVSSLGYSVRVEGVWWLDSEVPFEFNTQFRDHMA